jgi:hypothetical protein
VGTTFDVDTVGATSGALASAIQTYGLDRVLFGINYPWLANRLALIDHAVLAAAHRLKIMAHRSSMGASAPMSKRPCRPHSFAFSLPAA